MKKFLPAFFAIFFFPIFSTAQDFLGYANSNYAGVNGMFLNPASIADSRYRVDVILGGFNFNAQNNYIGFKKSAFDHTGSWKSAIIAHSDGDSTTPGFPAFDDKNFQYDYLTRRDYSSRTKSVFVSNRIQGPGFMASFEKGGFAVGLDASVRTYANIDGLEQPLAKQVFYAFEDSAQYFKSYQNKNFSIQTMSWLEIGITYSQVILDDQENFVKVGLRPKLLFGIGSAYLFADNLQYMTTTDSTLTFFKSDIEYGHSDNFEFSDSLGFNYKPYKQPGFGFDIGVVYEWRPDWMEHKYDMDGETNLWRLSQNKYKLRVGLSILDVGAIKFRRGEFSNSFTADINNWNIDALGDGLSGTTPVRAFDDSLRSRFASRPTGEYYSMNLPTAWSVQVDYLIWKDFYVNFTSFVAVQWKHNPNKVHELTTFSLTPRWDHKWFGVMVPMSYNQYGNFNVGACVRLGPLVMGTNGLGAYFSKTKTVYGADLFLAIKVPIPYGEPRDRDNDHVSDKKDKCRDVPGVWEFLGCPDRDGDHVQDSEDVCPDEPGLAVLNGCPDRDGDGITDKADNCPDDPGLPEFNGCPDKDGDGIIDKEDDCPEEKGLKEFKGCPDKDGDGLMDKLDKCPEKPGPLDNEGCPEVRLHLVDIGNHSLQSVRRSKDGTFTFEALPADSICIFRLEGDTDMIVGVNEVIVMVNGLPKRAIRSQADGLYRFDIPKPKAKDVAVQLTKEEQAVIKKAFDNLEFETGKDVIRAGSYASLDELATLLKKHPEWGIVITGHTDNVGKPTANLTLSKKRAEAVKKYLVSQGVPANHIKTEWYGQTRPIAPNTTPEGRQKNRRVEMMIVDYYTGMDAPMVEEKKTTPAKKPAAKKPPVKK
jgi:outer membrane protein OmpA-like peptidoglycan-associated protein